MNCEDCTQAFHRGLANVQQGVTILREEVGHSESLSASEAEALRCAIKIGRAHV